MKTTIGQRVRVLPSSTYYPGRVGVVDRLNTFSQNLDGSLNHDGLWFVSLEPTTRAKARVELFWGDDLEPMQDERQGVTITKSSPPTPQPWPLTTPGGHIAIPRAVPGNGYGPDHKRPARPGRTGETSETV